MARDDRYRSSLSPQEKAWKEARLVLQTLFAKIYTLGLKHNLRAASSSYWPELWRRITKFEERLRELVDKRFDTKQEENRSYIQALFEGIQAGRALYENCAEILSDDDREELKSPQLYRHNTKEPSVLLAELTQCQQILATHLSACEERERQEHAAREAHYQKIELAAPLSHAHVSQPLVFNAHLKDIRNKVLTYIKNKGIDLKALTAAIDSKDNVQIEEACQTVFAAFSSSHPTDDISQNRIAGALKIILCISSFLNVPDARNDDARQQILGQLQILRNEQKKNMFDRESGLRAILDAALARNETLKAERLDARELARLDRIVRGDSVAAPRDTGKLQHQPHGIEAGIGPTGEDAAAFGRSRRGDTAAAMADLAVSLDTDAASLRPALNKIRELSLEYLEKTCNLERKAIHCIVQCLNVEDRKKLDSLTQTNLHAVEKAVERARPVLDILRILDRLDKGEISQQNAVEQIQAEKEKFGAPPPKELSQLLRYIGAAQKLKSAASPTPAPTPAHTATESPLYNRALCGILKRFLDCANTYLSRHPPHYDDRNKDAYVYAKKIQDMLSSLLAPGRSSTATELENALFAVRQIYFEEGVRSIAKEEKADASKLFQHMREIFSDVLGETPRHSTISVETKLESALKVLETRCEAQHRAKRDEQIRPVQPAIDALTSLYTELRSTPQKVALGKEFKAAEAIIQKQLIERTLTPKDRRAFYTHYDAFKKIANEALEQLVRENQLELTIDPTWEIPPEKQEKIEAIRQKLAALEEGERALEAAIKRPNVTAASAESRSSSDAIKRFTLQELKQLCEKRDAYLKHSEMIEGLPRKEKENFVRLNAKLERIIEKLGSNTCTPADAAYLQKRFHEIQRERDEIVHNKFPHPAWTTPHALADGSAPHSSETTHPAGWKKPTAADASGATHPAAPGAGGSSD